MKCSGLSGEAHATQALSEDRFAALMEAVGPFEAEPTVAVAVSGGSDSLALASLVHRWAQSRGGRAIGLTVDHGLRPSAYDEAQQTCRWLAGWGMDHALLRITDPITGGDIQAQARRLRYQLLERWCEEAGCLHLCLAHHLDDQAETFLIRLGRGSGVRGLSAMDAISYRRSVRLLRPLLGERKATLQATLAAQGQPWITDPSNENSTFLRVKVRQAQAPLNDLGLGAERLVATAARLADASWLAERHVVRYLAGALESTPWGWAWLKLAGLADLGPEAGPRALAGLLTAYGGNVHPPRFERLRRVYDLCIRPLDAPDHPLWAGVTLHGCHLQAQRGPDESPENARLLICRENRHIATVALASEHGPPLWDGRFRFSIPQLASGAGDWAIGPVGKNIPRLTPINEAGYQTGEKKHRVTAWKCIPGMARGSLPALYLGGSLVAVPALGWARDSDARDMVASLDLRFSPGQAMALVGFRLAVGGTGII